MIRKYQNFILFELFGGEMLLESDLENAHNELTLVLEQLKLMLKARKITYAQLAQGLGVAESTLKKTFVAKDCSFNRLNEICYFLNINLSDILKSIEEQRVTEIAFAEDVEKHFLTNRTALRVYWELTFERSSLEDLLAAKWLTREKLFSILKELDSFGLIELLPYDKVQVAKLVPVKWKRNKTKLQEEIYLQWSKKVIDDTYAEKEEDFNISLLYYQLREETLEDFRRELRELEDKYSRLTIRDLKLYPDEIKKVRYLSSYTPGRFIRE